jgi:crossover junction endodeoxyribonuclease RuvC
MRKVLGIDPGKSGGLSVVDENFNLVDCMLMPTITTGSKERVDARGVHAFISKYSPDLVVVELVGARRGNGSVSMFSFGDSYGQVRAVAEILCADVRYARPQEWRGYQGLSGLGKEQIAEVAYEIFKAEAIFGRLYKGARTIRDGISDSLMIAKYGVRFLE